MRESKAWIFLGVGLLLTALTGFAIYGLAQQTAQGNTPLSSASKTVEVVVAKVDLPVRTVITAELVTRKAFPADLVPAGAYTQDADAIGQTTIAPIARGQSIVAGQLSSAEGQHGA